MCLAVPGQLKQIDGAFAVADFGGVRRRVGLALTPQAAVGDFVLVHAGMAIQVIDVEEAQRTLALIREAYADAVGPLEDADTGSAPAAGPGDETDG